MLQHCREGGVAQARHGKAQGGERGRGVCIYICVFVCVCVFVSICVWGREGKGCREDVSACMEAG